MGAIQIVEMGYQGFDSRSRIECLQHVLAYETGQIADRFQRNGLMEKIEGLFAFKSEPAAESGSVGRKRIEGRFDLGKVSKLFSK